MSLAHDIYDRLQQAAIIAEQEQRSTPRGLIPMSREQGSQVLHNLRMTPPASRPHLRIRPMTTDEGAQILHRLSSPSAPPTQPTLPPTPIKTFLQRFLK